MKRKLTYKGENPIHLLYPVDQRFEKGDTIEVNNKEQQAELEELGFKLESIPAKKDEKEGDE